MRTDGADERVFFGVFASLCPACGYLALDSEASRILGIAETDITCAIESDRYLQLGHSPDAA